MMEEGLVELVKSSFDDSFSQKLMYEKDVTPRLPEGMLGMLIIETEYGFRVRFDVRKFFKNVCIGGLADLFASGDGDFRQSLKVGLAAGLFDCLLNSGFCEKFDEYECRVISTFVIVSGNTGFETTRGRLKEEVIDTYGESGENIESIIIKLKNKGVLFSNGTAGDDEILSIEEHIVFEYKIVK